jgi:hypothetical protein
MKNFRAADKSHAGGDEKYDINFHWPCIFLFIKNISLQVHIACIFVILNFILFCTHAAAAVLQVYHASHTIY